MTKEQQKNEAIKRMKMLNLHENVIREFNDKEVLNISEHGGMLYWIEDELLEAIKKFEEKYNYVVYHAIHNYTEFGELLALLYVSDNEEEWEDDRLDIKDNYALAYVINLDDSNCSEFGSIGIKQQYGGLIRTA